MIDVQGLFGSTQQPVYSTVTFEDVRDILRDMRPSERRKVADYLVCEASTTMVMSRRWDIANGVERHM